MKQLIDSARMILRGAQNENPILSESENAEIIALAKKVRKIGGAEGLRSFTRALIEIEPDFLRPGEIIPWLENYLFGLALARRNWKIIGGESMD